MNLITPFTILNRKFNEMDLIRDAIKNRRLATERLREDYRKMYKIINLPIENRHSIHIAYCSIC